MQNPITDTSNTYNAKKKFYFSEIIKLTYLFNWFKEKSLKNDYQEEMSKLLDDEEVQNKKGIYW